jgi:radical SAM family uncharacterized protein/radical SAM-linked protein
MKSLLKYVSRPGRYLGSEINAVRKDHGGRLRFALAFPDLYEVGMSHLGLQILYSLLNARDDIVCERVFTPWPDMADALRGANLPLSSLESGTPLRDFDILGFSLEYELSYSNVLEMLSLAGIPFEAIDRGEGDPVIIGGGPCCFNPEPVARFFDAFLLGEGEEAVLEIAAAVSEWKRGGGGRPELLGRLAAIPGVYVPSFFEDRYLAGGELAELIPLRPGYEFIERRVIADLDTAPAPERPIVPSTQIIHDRLRIELARGCTRGCRFCQAGIIYRPVRERSPERVLELAKCCLAATGFEEVSLLSLSAGDYSRLAPLLTTLIDRHYADRVAVSLPSLRVGTLSPEVIEQVKRVRKTGFTLAPEAATERLRRVINKNISEDELLETARVAYWAGWNVIKLYFMAGLPTETQEDIAAIPGLTRRVASGRKGGRGQVNASISLFVPKPHTPFQWERAASPEEGRAKIEWLKANTARGVKLKWNNHDQSLLEAVFSRGDRRLSDVLLSAHRLGCRFDSWGDQLRFDLWREAFKQAQIDPGFYLRERGAAERLPWDHLRPGVRREYLEREREKALAPEPTFTPDCRLEGCLDCGVCGDSLSPRLASRQAEKQVEEAPEPRPAYRTPSRAPQGTPRHIRVHYAKLEDARFIGHLEIVRLMYRAFRRSRVPVAYSQGFHPLPRLSFGKALPVGVESLAEYVDAELAEGVAQSRYPAARLAKDLGAVLPAGLKVLGVEEAPPGRKFKPPHEEAYVVGLDGAGLNREDAAVFMDRQSCETEIEGRKGTRLIDLRQVVRGLEFVDDTSLRLALSLQPQEAQVRPEVAVRYIFGLSPEEVRALTLLKVS